MSLSLPQLERAAVLESCQQRLLQLSRMGAAQLHALLSGDPAEVAVWIGSAAECGLPTAQLSLGRMLLEGRGVPRDPAAALCWFTRAAAGGNAEAQNMLGRCYENGWGTAVELPRAAACYRASAEGGHDWGQYNFGNLLFDGRGMGRDLRAAVGWYVRAAQQGHGRAMNLLGRCLEEGWGCARSLDDADYWYRRSAESGYFRGQFNHAITLSRCGQAAAAADWFWRAACGGDADLRRALVAALAGARDPALLEVRRRVWKLLRAPPVPSA